jgi:probable F420-dependent oxidoreductase
MLAIDTALMAERIEDIATATSRAEQIGFSGVMTAEASHEPFLPLMIAAEHTRRLELLTGIAVAFPRSPMITAYTAWDLQRYSNGRFLLGLGTQVKGHNERRFSTAWDRPVARLRELVLALRAIWACWQNGSKLDFHGTFYRFDLMTPFFSPGPQEHPYIPIYIAGVNRNICRLAGELCDGFHVHPMHTVKYIRDAVKPWIAEGATKVGRSPESVKLVSACFVVTGDDDAEIAASAAVMKQQIAFYASTRTYAPILAQHGWEELSPQLNDLSRHGRWSDMGDMITDDMLKEFAVIGARDQIGDLLKRKYEGVLDRISLYLPYMPGAQDDWWADVVAKVKRG